MNSFHPFASGRRLVSAVPLLLALPLAACSMGLPETQDLGPLRVLALQSTASEVNPAVDGSFTITPVVSDVDGGGRTLTYSFQTCLDFGVSLGAPADCDSDPTASEPRTGTFTLSGPHYTGVVTPAAAGDFDGVVPATLLLGRGEVDLWNGISYLVLFKVSTEDGEEVTSFRRIVATSRTTGLNVNPEISGLTDAEGSALASTPSEETDLQPVLGASVAEEYVAKALDGEDVERTETLTISWYLSRGTFSNAKTVAGDVEPESFVNTWTPPEDETELADAFLFAVIRDDRGGVGFLSAPLTP